MRPSLPVPAIARGSSVCSASNLRTTGESLSSGKDLARGDAGPRAGAWPSLAVDAIGAAAPADAPEAAEDADPDSRITASRAPTLAVVPSATMISATTPATGEGISVLTLSVSTSNKVSSALIESPTFLYHLVTVPSATVSPSCGMI